MNIVSIALCYLLPCYLFAVRAITAGRGYIERLKIIASVGNRDANSSGKSEHFA